MTNLKHWTRWFKKKIPGKKLSPQTGKTEAGYTYIMSDLHGCFDELNAMLAKIGFSDQDKLILAGDYIDRGSQNYEMLCWMEQVPQNILLLRGNLRLLLNAGANQPRIQLTNILRDNPAAAKIWSISIRRQRT